MKRVFLSYSHRDKAFAGHLARDLRQAGVRVWIDEAEVRIGESLIDKISKAILEVDYLIAVLSPNSVASPWVREELEQAYNLQIIGRTLRVLPVLYQTCELPQFLAHRKYVDFTSPDNYSVAFAQLMGQLVDGGPTSLRRSLEYLRKLEIPSFYLEQPADAISMNRLQHAINAVETVLDRRPTRFEPFYAGQLATAASMNQLFQPLVELRILLGFETKLKGWPVTSGQPMAVDTMNGIADAINKLMRKVIDEKTRGAPPGDS